MNSVRWYRPSINGCCTVQVDEGHGWVSYKQSLLYKPDTEAFSPGYLTFLNCLKAGYTHEPLFSNYV